MGKPFTTSQKAKISEKLMDLGNIAIGALLFGQAVSNTSFNLIVAILGIVVFSWLYSIAILILRR